MKQDKDHTEFLRYTKQTKIKRTLCFYNPKEVYMALTSNIEVKRWLEFISNHYVPPKVKICLIYPCSAIKPYYESRSYKRLYNTLSKLGDARKQIHVLTISEPFGLVPEEFYRKNTEWHDWENSWYDCPGLFEWWCRRHKQPYSKDYLEKCIKILATYISKFLIRAKARKSYSKIIAFIRTFSSQLKVKEDHTHRRIVELASKIAKVQVDLLPPKQLVKEIVLKRGRLAWDLYGVSHPMAQEYLLRYLLKVLNDEG